MTVCKKCGGSGWDDEHMIKCLHCHGSGEVQMTNEEWFCQLSTEEKAEWMALRLNPGILLALRMKYHCTNINAVREWLKQPHKE